MKQIPQLLLLVVLFLAACATPEVNVASEATGPIVQVFHSPT